MKKLISIGVALALLTMAVVPGAVAAQTEPTTYSKIPFAIIGSGLELMADLWGIIDTPDPGLDIGMPWIADVLDTMAPWTAGPLSWTVDMLAWGVSLFGDVMAAAGTLIEAMDVTLPFDLAEIKAITDTMACGLLTSWNATVTGGEFTPCG